MNELVILVILSIFSQTSLFLFMCFFDVLFCVMEMRWPLCFGCHDIELQHCGLETRNDKGKKERSCSVFYLCCGNKGKQKLEATVDRESLLWCGKEMTKTAGVSLEAGKEIRETRKSNDAVKLAAFFLSIKVGRCLRYGGTRL